jgi:alpha-aminoadipic semialdehyde synthase
MIGIRREDKNIWEKRVPLIPTHVKELIKKHQLKFSLQPSPQRIFKDQDYIASGAAITEDLSDCKIIMAVKEIPPRFFQKEKTYIFFSHTIKGQSHNMRMLKKMIELECTLIDYEKITNDKGHRLVFFGTQAGQAGMIDSLWAFGKRLDHEHILNPFSKIRQSHQYASLTEVKEQIKAIGWHIHQKGLDERLTPLICGFTGYGRVSEGAQEIYNLLPVEKVSPGELERFHREKTYASNKVFQVIFKEQDMVEPVDIDAEFNLQDYYDHPEKYRSKFDGYVSFLDILINCIYWTPQYPRFVTKSLLADLWKKPDSPRLRVIGDISCDIEGSIECTEKATEPDNPIYVYDPIERNVTDGWKGRGVVIMAVDTLPAEIPLESSLFFSSSLKPLIPGISKADFTGKFDDCHLPSEVKRAVILFRGEFTPEFEYMKKFLY